MKEGAVLVVGKRVVYFLVPYDASVRWGDIYQLDPECVAHEIVRQNSSALEAAVRPPVAIGVSDIKPGDGNGLYLICGFGDCALDRLLVMVGEDRGHDYSSQEGC